MKIYSFMSLNQNIQESLSKSGIHLEIHSMEQITDKQLKKAFLENDILIIGLHHHMDAMWLKEITTPKIVATLSIGVDHIDSLYFQHPMIQVLHCVYGNTLSVAEHILALILALNKNVISSYHYVMGNTTQMNSITSTENSYQTLGLIGAGHISQKLIEIMSGFHMNILIYTAHPEQHQDLIGKKVRFVSLETLLKSADIISINVPNTDSTKNLLSKECLSLVKKNATIINTSRLEVVDTMALLELARTYPSIKVGMDVDIDKYKKEFQQVGDNVLLTPHIAGKTKAAQYKMQLELVNQILKCLEKNNI